MRLYGVTYRLPAPSGFEIDRRLNVLSFDAPSALAVARDYLKEIGVVSPILLICNLIEQSVITRGLVNKMKGEGRK